jgi:hypothetical protein
MKGDAVVMIDHGLFPNPIQRRHFGWMMDKVAGSCIKKRRSRTPALDSAI